MASPNPFVESLVAPDTRRLIEDLAATMPLYDDIRRNGRPIHPTAAILSIAGDAYLDSGARVETFKTLDHPGLRPILDAWHYPIEPARVNLSYFLAGVVLARKDVCALFTQDDELDWLACLQWLLMHGVYELQLWPFISSAFVASLRADTVRAYGQKISPLELLVIRERPELLEQFGGVPNEEFRLWFPGWLSKSGLQEHHLFWTLTRNDFRRLGVTALQTVPVGTPRSSTPLAVRAGAGLDSMKPLLVTPLPALFTPLRPGYPCSYLDFANAEQAAHIAASTTARLSPQGELDVVGPTLSIQLPDGQYSANAFAIVELTFPPAVDPELKVAIEVEGVGEWEWKASEIADQPLTVPFAFRRRAPCLRIFFRGKGIPMHGMAGPVAYYGTVRSIRLWNVDV